MKKRWIVLLLTIVGIAAVVVWRGRQKAETTPRSAENSATPVVLADVRESDVPIWLSGIGTVQASNTVTVRPRTGGALDKVTFTEGAMVKEGDVLAQIDPRPYQSALSQAKAKQTQDEALLANAVLASNRFEALVKTDAVSQQEVDQAGAAVAELTAMINADKAAVEAAQLNLDLTVIRAPIGGRTGMRLIDAGNLVTADQAGGLVVITQLQPVSVVFSLPQQNLAELAPQVRPGSAPLKVEAIADDGKVLGDGLLELIDNQIDPASGTLRLKATFRNDDLTLWPGQFVSARVLVKTREKVVTVPTEAVMPGLDGQFCYVVKPDQTVEPRSIRTGAVIDGRTLIEEGLKAGEFVVVTGQGKLKPGARVVTQKKAS